MNLERIQGDKVVFQVVPDLPILQQVLKTNVGRLYVDDSGYKFDKIKEINIVTSRNTNRIAYISAFN